ncbi:hypothetical protein GCM10009642_38360 [Nocardiopsis metallicus]
MGASGLWAEAGLVPRKRHAPGPRLCQSRPEGRPVPLLALLTHRRPILAKDMTQRSARATVALNCPPAPGGLTWANTAAQTDPDQRGGPKDDDSQHPSPHGGGGEKQGK